MALYWNHGVFSINSASMSGDLGVQTITPAGISGLGAAKIPIRFRSCLIEEIVTLSVFFPNRHEAISGGFFLDFFLWYQDTIDVQVAYFALSLSLTKFMVDCLPFLTL